MVIDHSHHLTFQEQALTEDGKPGDVMMDGRCKPVAGSAKHGNSQ
jgi:hypothetical protein